jgi:hypothetical protein
MTAHRYWRILIALNDGGGVHAGQQCQFRAVAGGPNVATGGTATASSTFGGFSVTNLFANTGQWASGGNGLEWVEYDFGAGVTKDIVEVVWQARTDNSQNQTPDVFCLQFSDDNSTWTDRCYMHKTGWTLGQTIVFTQGTTPGGSHINWGFAPTAVPSAYSINELQHRATIGGSSLDVGGTASDGFDDGTNVASHAFDGSNSTVWATSINRLPNYILYALPSSSAVAQVAITAENSNPSKTPTAGNVIYSDDGLCWSIAYSVTPTTWSSLQTQTFNNPSAGENGTVAMTFGALTLSASGNDKTASVSMKFGALTMTVTAHDAPPNELGTLAMSFGKISFQVAAVKPPPPGTGVRQFWTFGN